MARTLPRWMHEKHGAYYLVRNNKWHRLAGNLHDALVEYARLTAGPDKGALGELVSKTLADMKLTVAATDAKAQGLDSKTLLGHTTESSHNRYLRSKETKVATPNRARKA